MNLKKIFWEEAYQRNIAKMIAVCYRYVSDKELAEDLAQDAFVVAMQKAESFSGKGHFDAWLRKIAVNTALMYLRESKRWNETDKEELTQCLLASQDKDDMYSDFTIEQLLQMIEALPEHHRLVFNMYVLDGYSHKDIAKELNISIGTSKSHLARARRKLQDAISKKERHKQSRFLLMLIPCKFGSVDKLYRRRLLNLEISPRHSAFPTTTEWHSILLPKISMASQFAVYSGVGILTATLLSIALFYGLSKDKTLPTNSPLNVPTNTLRHANERGSDVCTDTALHKPTEHVSEPDTSYNKEVRQEREPIIVKKSRLVRKKLIVRDTIIIIDSANAK
ncbi:MAG: RNA polymerase sigma factor [Bacteroidales bacterium]